DAAGNRAHVTAKGAVGTADELHREPHIHQISVSGDVYLFQVTQQWRAPVPRHCLGRVNDVLTLERAHGDECDVAETKPGGEVGKVGADLAEGGFDVIDQVHLVDRYDDVADPQEGGDEGVATGLGDDPVGGIDEQDGQVGGAGAGDHVPGVLLVARGVGD